MRNRVAGYQHPFAVMVVVGRCRLVEVDEHVRRAQANVGAAHSIGCWDSREFLWSMRQTPGRDMVTAGATGSSRWPVGLLRPGEPGSTQGAAEKPLPGHRPAAPARSLAAGVKEFHINVWLFALPSAGL